jgi:hypothetical protein
MTGVTPAEALLRATSVLNGHPDPLLPANEVHEQVTPAVAEVISKAMSQNAAQRPQTAAAMREALREAARQGHSAVRETNPLPVSSSNVYEEDTKLMFSSAPSTKVGEAVEETGTMRVAAGATAVNSTPEVSAAAAASTTNPESVVTKVAKADKTALKNQPRSSRAFVIAASAAVLIAVAAVVYTFTRNNAHTPSSQETIQSTPALSPTSNSETQTNSLPAETTNGLPATPETPPQEKTTTTSTKQPTKVIIQSGTVHKPERVVVEDDDDPELPEPPDPGERPDPRRPPRRIPRPGDPQFEEAMRAAEDARRAGEEARRAAREQRRLMLLKQRQEMIERERRRRQQQQMP